MEWSEHGFPNWDIFTIWEKIPDWEMVTTLKRFPNWEMFHKWGGAKLVCACTEFLVGSCILKTSLFEINPKWLSALSCNNVAIKPSDEVIDEDVSENDTA